jgi:hypothetical protein
MLILTVLGVSTLPVPSTYNFFKNNKTYANFCTGTDNLFYKHKKLLKSLPRVPVPVLNKINMTMNIKSGA